MSIKIEKKRKVSEMIVDELIDQIRSGKMKVGEKLPNERTLAESLKVSRMPLREAIHALGQVGILETRHGEGTFVSAYDSEKLGRTLYWYSLLNSEPLFQLLETRSILEVEAAKMACKNATAEDLQAIKSAMLDREALINQTDISPDSKIMDKRFDADRCFHEAIARASHNSIFSSFLHSIRSSLHLHQETTANINSTPANVSQIHREIYEAIIERDEEKAALMMKKHMDLIIQAVHKDLGE